MSIRDLENRKFLKDSSGNLQYTDNGNSQIVVAGQVGPSGLNIGGRVTQVLLTDASWTALPTTNLDNRNTLAIQVPNDGSIFLNFQLDRVLNAVQATGTDTLSAITITADTAGTAGNVSLVFDGVDDIDTVILDHNTNFPSNTVSLTTGTGTDVLAAQTITLTGGLDMISYGWEVKASGEFFFDVSNDIAIYALADTGITPTVTIMEIA